MLRTTSSLSLCASLRAKQIARWGSCWTGSVPTSSTRNGEGDWEWCWTLGLTPSFTTAVAGAVDLLLPALTCCCRASLNLQGCSELCVPRDTPYGPGGSCPVLVQPCLHELNSGTTIINIMSSKKMSCLFSYSINQSPLKAWKSSHWFQWSACCHSSSGEKELPKSKLKMHLLSLFLPAVFLNLFVNLPCIW